MNRTVKLTATLVLACLSLASFAQERQGPPGGGRFAGLQRVSGTLESIASDKLVIKDAEGKSTTVKITSETQFRKDRQPAGLGDFKTGDRVVAAGKSGSDGIVVAQFVAAGQMMRGGRGEGGPMGAPGGMEGGHLSPEEMVRMGLGTRFIAGEVKKIDGTNLTILRPDGQTQVITVNEDTSFLNGKNESVTLADLKAGDHVRGRGEMKNGVFVPEALHVGGSSPQGPSDPKQHDQKQ